MLIRVLLFPFRRLRSLLLRWLSFCINALLLGGVYLAARFQRKKHKDPSSPKLVWGSVPIANNIYWSRAMREVGYVSETFTYDYYSIHKRDDWDLILFEKYSWVPLKYRYYFGFVEAIRKYDVFFVSFDGFFLGQTRFWKHEAPLLQLANKKIVAIPYGGDAYVYHKIDSTSLIHGLLMSYPDAARHQEEKNERLLYWTKHADCFMPGIMGTDGMGRWDVLAPSSLGIDCQTWKASTRNSNADGTNDTVYIGHAPNHRGFKGTEFVIDIVRKLQESGLKVELVLIEGRKNDEVRRIFERDIDILVEQVISTGYGLNGLEGMVSGLPVICNLEDEQYVLRFRRWSFLNECPIMSGSPENLFENLKILIERPDLRRQLGNAGRQYAQKYHSPEAMQFLFSQVIDFVYKRRGPLINLYHPITGEYGMDSKIQHPLINNKFIS